MFELILSFDRPPKKLHRVFRQGISIIIITALTISVFPGSDFIQVVDLNDLNSSLLFLFSGRFLEMAMILATSWLITQWVPQYFHFYQSHRRLGYLKTKSGAIMNYEQEQVTGKFGKLKLEWYHKIYMKAKELLNEQVKSNALKAMHDWRVVTEEKSIFYFRVLISSIVFQFVGSGFSELFMILIGIFCILRIYLLTWESAFSDFLPYIGQKIDKLLFAEVKALTESGAIQLK